MLRRTRVDFDRHLWEWDGFGVNYVETAQTRDYASGPQEYGGFSLLREEQRQEIINLIFGADGLKPGVLKMFLDPFHQPDPDTFDHTTTTQWMRYFARTGLALTRSWGGDLKIITTLYGPPRWMTKQKFVRGRDLDPACKYDMAEYMIAWAKYLRETEGLPVQYISLHNEGEDWVRWPADGSTDGAPNHDYNMYWPPEQVVEFLKIMRPMLDRQGLADVGLTPGETTNWYRFVEWGYAHAIADDPEALRNLGLITSHGFAGARSGHWFGDWRSAGTDILRAAKPGLHSWVTSTSWSKMDAAFVNEIRQNIYCAKVNAIIPWAAVQVASRWVGGDPNPGTAFRITEDGQYSIEPGYYFYKQVSRAGQPGMAVCRVTSNDSEVGLIGFAANGTDHPDALVVINTSERNKDLDLELVGTEATVFEAYRTAPGEQYVALGRASVVNGKIPYTAPAGSVTTFYGVK